MSRFSYVSRPAKHVVRQLLAEACRRLTPIEAPSAYRYVGFGGLEFLDFDLFRRSLGIERMASIEKDTNAYARYRFNRPFAGIDVLPGTASDRLVDIEWEGLTIVWLDYTGQLGDEVLADVSFVAHEILAGSVLIVTLNAVSPKPAHRRRETLVTNVTEERVPLGLTDDGLAQWGWAEAQRDILLSELDRRLSVRRDQARFEQLFDFVYADDAEMQTMGGLVVTPGMERLLDQCRFEDLPFVRRRGGGHLEVKVPVLTDRERLHLDQQLPLGAGAGLEAEGIEGPELDAYEHFYRWYPVSS